MELDIELINNNIIVSELCDDLIINNVPVMYDSDSPYMICTVVKSGDSLVEENSIVVIKRYTKEAFLPGYYFISLNDVRGIISRESYEKYIAN